MRPSVRAALLGGFLVLLTFSAYSNHFHNAFQFDDSHVIVENPYVKDIKNLTRFFTDPHTKSTLPTNLAYRPMLMVTLAVDYWLAGDLDPFTFHLSNFIWLLVQGALMVLLFKRIIDLAAERSWSLDLSIVLAGLYCVHTANAETINYVTARSDSLTTLCVVMALVIEMYGRSWLRHLSWLPIIVGCLIKPTTVMYVPLLFLYRVIFEQGLGLSQLLERRNRKVLVHELRRILPIGVVCLGLFVFCTMMTPDTWNPGGPSRFRYLLTQPYVIMRYVLLFFLPFWLSPDTDWQAVQSLQDYRIYVGTVLLALLLIGAWATTRSRTLRPIGYGLFWFLLALVPSSSIIPLAEVTNDHRMFFPFVGLTLSVGWAAALLVERFLAQEGRSRRWRYVLAALVVAVLTAHAYGTYQRNKVWATHESLWRDVIEKSPKNGRGLMNYGLNLMNQGAYEEALRYYERAMGTSYGQHAYLYINRGIALGQLERHSEAEENFKTAVRNGPRLPASHYYFGRWLSRRGRREEAIPHLEKAIELSPGYEPAKVLLQAIEEGVSLELYQARKRLEKNPTADGWLDLSLQYYRAGKKADCIAAAKEVLKLKPDSAAAYNNICAAHNALKQWDQAIEACQAALEIQPDYPLARNNLAWAQREGGAQSE